MSKPYYDFFLHSFGLPLLLLMGIGPLVAWRRASLRALGKTFLDPARGVARDRRRPARARLRLLDAGPPRVHVLRVRRRIDRARVRARHAGAHRLGSGRACDRRRTAAATAATSSTRRSSCSRSASPARARTRRCASAASSPGQSMELAGYTLTYEHARRRGKTANAVATRAVVDVDARQLARRHAAPGQELLPGCAEQPRSNEVSIYHDPRNLGDLFTDRRPDRQERARST